MHRCSRWRGAIRTGCVGLALACALGSGAFADPAPARSGAGGPETSLEALMRGMSETRGVVARFRERKELALLSEPLESSGRFVFVPPDRLSRVTESPSPSKLVIDGDRVFFHDGQRGEALDLSANPVAREYVRNFTALFGGDLDELERRYVLDLEGDAAGAWQLRLVPRSPALRRVIETVVLVGSGRVLEHMELVESGGDRTLTWFESVRTDVELPDDELAALFAVPDASTAE